MPEPLRLQLHLPALDLSRLSVGSADPRAMAAWLQQLPVLDLGDCARQLYTCLQELNRLPLEPRRRWSLLELLRPRLEEIGPRLERHYLSSARLPTPRALKVARVAQSMDHQLAIGYKRIAVDAMQMPRRWLEPDRSRRGLRAQACQRALLALGRMLLRASQMYLPAPRHLWLECHQLLRLAESVSVHNHPVPEGTGICTPQQAYLRTVLMMTARPNQLRPQELAWLASQWPVWVHDVLWSRDGDGLFVVDLVLDRGPVYRSHLERLRETCRVLDVSRLLERLRDPAACPADLRPSLRQHLLASWRGPRDRTMDRVPRVMPVAVCCGLAALHHHLEQEAAGQAQADALAGRAARQRFLTMDPEPVAAAAPLAGRSGMMHSLLSTAPRPIRRDQPSLPASSFPTYPCHTMNVSPGGYGLSWSGPGAPPPLRTGELVGVREGGRSEWAVCLVRWVQQCADGSVRFGVERLAAQAHGVLGQLQPRVGTPSDWLRLLWLPEQPTLEQPPTLLTPAIGFASGMRVILATEAGSQEVTLGECLMATAGVARFAFDQPADTAGQQGPETPEQELASVWRHL